MHRAVGIRGKPLADACLYLDLCPQGWSTRCVFIVVVVVSIRVRKVPRRRRRRRLLVVVVATGIGGAGPWAKLAARRWRPRSLERAGTPPGLPALEVSLVPDLLGKVHVEQRPGYGVEFLLLDGRAVVVLDEPRQAHAPLAPAAAVEVREIAHGNGVRRVLVCVVRILLEWVVRFAESPLASLLAASSLGDSPAIVVIVVIRLPILFILHMTIILAVLPVIGIFFLLTRLPLLCMMCRLTLLATGRCFDDGADVAASSRFEDFHSCPIQVFCYEQIRRIRIRDQLCNDHFSTYRAWEVQTSALAYVFVSLFLS